jgi:DNA-binding MarR family transcriptional regulator
VGEQREYFLASGAKDTEFERFVYALEWVRGRFPAMTLGAFTTFLSIARNNRRGGITPTELAEQLRQPLPTIFRQCNQLSDGLPGKPGMNLIKKVIDASDGRAKKLTLSLKGLGVLTGMLDILSIEIPFADDQQPQ